jgi:hypothetical protein
MNSSDTAERLRAQVELPEAWKPHDGSPATLVGEVIAETEIPYKDRNGVEQTCPAFVVRDGNGKEWTVATFHSVLRNELLEHPQRGRLQPHDWVAIHYRGQRTSETGTDYHAYRVAVERPDPPAEPNEYDPATAELPEDF